MARVEAAAAAVEVASGRRTANSNKSAAGVPRAVLRSARWRTDRLGAFGVRACGDRSAPSAFGGAAAGCGWVE